MSEGTAQGKPVAPSGTGMGTLKQGYQEQGKKMGQRGSEGGDSALFGCKEEKSSCSMEGLL